VVGFPLQLAKQQWNNMVNYEGIRMNHLSMRLVLTAVVLALLPAPQPARADQKPDKRFPLFAYLTSQPAPSMVAYTPSELDPRQPTNQRNLATSSIRADLRALRPHFDGLILYGYHEACTPRLVAVAQDLKFRALLLGIWDPRSAAEVDGVASLVKQFQSDFVLGVIVGNEGITFKRYEAEDVRLAAARLKLQIPKTIAVTTSEPLAGYGSAFVRDFGDFLAPNIHPAFDRPQLGAEQAAAWARQQAARLARQAKKPVLLKETGLPHGGKKAYTPASQKAFWAAYLKPGILARPSTTAHVWVFHGVAFEAFDLPWKVAESKLPIEAFWGLLSKDRKPYPALAVWKAPEEGNTPKKDREQR
jgi:exo-beta-1,3-glucanase (GH17 family)